jgi:hypothetical protein
VAGPISEFSQAYVRTTADAALWPLALMADGIGCPRCGRGLLLRPAFKAKYFEQAELMALVEEHLPNCPAAPELEHQ